MKKVLSLLLIGAMLVGVVGCGKDAGEIYSTAAMRQWSPEDADHIFIDDEAIALAQSIGSGASPELANAARAAFDACNAQRSAAGLGALTWSNGLADAAMVRAQEAVGTWSHTRPNGSDYWTVNSSLVYGENLAKGYSSADAAVSAWMASPTHKDNILFSGFRTGGIAIYEQGGMWYWAEEFGY